MFPTHPHTICQFSTLRTDDLMREAARERLANQAVSGRRWMPFHLAPLSLLGAALVWTGERIQGAPRVAPLAQPR